MMKERRSTISLLLTAHCSLLSLSTSPPNSYLCGTQKPNDMLSKKISELLGDKAEYYLNHTCKTIEKSTLHLPSPNHVDESWINSNRSNQVLRSLQSLLTHGHLAGTGYCSIFPVDQGIEHSAGASFAPNPIYFDPENIIRLAIEGGCNGVASTYGVLGVMSRKYAH